ncbi:MAG: YdcF family protein [Verrucomicrobia bacterium]|nr:YdcF family protein [Verrucomicrobiota bacterium]MBT7912149.1 YdcF family protein [Verrucomicrobiota bacterium]
MSANLHTRDEATNTAALAKEQGWKKIILVTSAWHMRRSVAMFEKVGLVVVPVGTDFVGTSALETHWSFYPVPWYYGFHTLSMYGHEQLGWLYYRLRGWI